MRAYSLHPGARVGGIRNPQFAIRYGRAGDHRSSFLGLELGTEMETGLGPATFYTFYTLLTFYTGWVGDLAS